jgi:hypothetical protein
MNETDTAALARILFYAFFFIFMRNLQENKLKCKNGSRIEARRASAVEITMRAATAH